MYGHLWEYMGIWAYMGITQHICCLLLWNKSFNISAVWFYEISHLRYLLSAAMKESDHHSTCTLYINHDIICIWAYGHHSLNLLSASVKELFELLTNSDLSHTPKIGAYLGLTPHLWAYMDIYGHHGHHSTYLLSASMKELWHKSFNISAVCFYERSMK